MPGAREYVREDGRPSCVNSIARARPLKLLVDATFKPHITANCLCDGLFGRFRARNEMQPVHLVPGSLSMSFNGFQY